MRLAYFDCFSGVSGAMALGALVHAGANADDIAERLERLPTIGFRLERETVEVGGISATRVTVKALPQDVIRTYSSIRAMLEKADLPERARWTAQRIFHRLAAAEAKVRNKEIDLVNHPRDRGRPLVSGDADERALWTVHAAGNIVALAASAALGRQAGASRHGSARCTSRATRPTRRSSRKSSTPRSP